MCDLAQVSLRLYTWLALGDLDMKELIGRLVATRDDFKAALEQLKTGRLETRTDGEPTTRETIAWVEAKIAELDGIIDKYGKSNRA